MKYLVEFELDENRKSCIGCPILGADDFCNLLDENDCYINGDTWDWQLANCLLKVCSE